MSEQITLPRSGLPLPLRKDCDASWVRVVPGIGALIVSGDVKTDGWCAIFGNLSEIGTREECIAWLDARVLELRAALLPADARERVARAISDEADLIVMEESRPQRMLRIADAGLAALRERLAAAERERDEALAANAAAVCAWQEYGRWPEMYGVVPIGRYRGPDGVEHEIALRADQITGITRGIMRHIESLLPSGLKMVEAMQNEGALKTRAETAEALVRELAAVAKAAETEHKHNAIHDVEQGENFAVHRDSCRKCVSRQATADALAALPPAAKSVIAGS